MREKPLKKELKSVLKEIQNKNAEGGKIITAWNKITESFIEHAEPGALKKRVLYVDVDDSDWMYICSLKIEKIKDGLKDFFKQGIIEEIKFRVGR
ncbi:MAG: DciA family protein [Candidatus Kaelpia imicola]|nr:DciA family protein [Candidatus Kaelpia imicola]